MKLIAITLVVLGKCMRKIRWHVCRLLRAKNWQVTLIETNNPHDLSEIGGPMVVVGHAVRNLVMRRCVPVEARVHNWERRLVRIIEPLAA